MTDPSQRTTQAELLALELIRRQIGGLPGEFGRIYGQMRHERTDPHNDPAARRSSARQKVDIQGFDPMLANQANRLAIQGWPKVIQLVNGLISILHQKAANRGVFAQADFRQGMADKEAKRLEFFKKYDKIFQTPKKPPPAKLPGTARKNTDRGYLDAARIRLLALRRAVGNKTSKAFGRATAFAGRQRDRVMNTRAGRFVSKEWNSKGGKFFRGGAAKGAGAVGGLMKGIGGALIGALSPFMIKLLAVVGPLALLATVLSDASSGFGLVISSVKLLASSLAPLLLPVMFLLAAGLATMSDIIWSKIAPGLESFYTVIFSNIVPICEELTTYFEDLVDSIADFIEFVKNPSSLFDTTRGSAGTTADPERTGAERGVGSVASLLDTAAFGPLSPAGLLTRAIGMDTPTPFSSAADMLTGEGGVLREGGDKPQGQARESAREVRARRRSEEQQRKQEQNQGQQNPMSKFQENMQKTLKEFQMSVGPKAQFMGLSQASKNAQLAALNKSPFEAEMMKRMMETVGALTKVVNNTTPQPEGRYDNAGGRRSGN